MKVLFLDCGFDSMNDIFRQEREKIKGVTSRCLYYKTTKRGVIFKIIQFFGIYIFNPILYLIYGNWKKELNQYDIYILPSRKSAIYAAKLLEKQKNKRIIIWYWNTVTKNELDPEYCKKRGYEVWSFDKSDCQLYGMKFADTYYFDIVAKDDNKIQYDLFYVGINQPGRKEILSDISNVLEKNKMSYKFNLCAFPNDIEKIQKQFDRRLEYWEIIDLIEKSNAILDLNKNNQVGMTLRPLEALFFNKKLITNNKFIGLYNKHYPMDNVLILDENYDNIIPFLLKPTIDVSKNKSFYTFEKWLERIKNNIEVDIKQ